MASVRTLSLATALYLLAGISCVSAHGFVQGIVIGGEYYPGFNPGAAPYQNPPPPVIGWPNTASDTGFVPPQDYSNPNIICHLNSRNGEMHAEIAAGSSIDLQWNQWDVSHHGPVIDYMARCDGECETTDKNALKFFKIDEAGLVNGSPAPGTWATDTLRANNLTWTTTIPATLAPGNYVLRHELIALHSADKPYGVQNYPQCINLKVTGTGTANPAGIPATEFYTPTDPGLSLSIYYPDLENYTIPGPALWDGASSGNTGSSSGMPAPSTVTVIPVPESSYVAPSPTPVDSVPQFSAIAYAAESTPSGASPLPESSVTDYAESPTPTDVSPLPESSIADHAESLTPTDVSPIPQSSGAASVPESSSAIEVVPSAATPVEPSMAATTAFEGTSTAAQELCSTTTLYTTITMTTTVQPGRSSEDVSPSSSEVAPVPTSVAETFSEAEPVPTSNPETSSEVALIPTSIAGNSSYPVPVPTSSAEESPEAAPAPTSNAGNSSYSAPMPTASAETSPEGYGDGYPTSVAESMLSSAVASAASEIASAVESAATPTAIISSVVASAASQIATAVDGGAATPTAALTSAVQSVASVIASAAESAATSTPTGVSEGSDTGLPGGMGFEEFIEWIKQFFTKYFGKKGSGRKHARDLVI
ncbi:hypothetical protein EPUS_03226 [Endocarpon pusillum Z07020]|uniref:Auxiliary Activity family 9 catalytic domain-containing protein n=1 Tax=Endocarpon pusillum (strain Z07020 / HMAS-L-300199) TaxID=1263415 RepID=U1GBC0_ENDPU|nr:uncharacterized protein EPUS_03226 [Endocarpon pusillum Z07020]ERF74842.1 hypothetical protein EPUS_03226 [Endocarpon pusillum Z07020]